MTKLTGLTDAEVAERRERGLGNDVVNRSSRSLTDILRANILTPFNTIIAVLAMVVVFFNKSPVNSLFFVAMVLNALVGIAQELNAKRILDRLAVLVKPRARVRRNGEDGEIASGEIVLDDLVILRLGDQILADGEIVNTDGIEIDESLLTGESDPITKNVGDQVMSGSMVVSGRGVMKVTKVGAESYSARLASEAKQYKRASSELIDSTNKLLKWISWLMIIVVPVLIIGQLRISQGNLQEAVIHTVAAIVGMIPEGLVLLTSAAFMLAVVKLARQKVLVQQLPAIETLARVNTLLLDKTGTITEGTMQFKELIQFNRTTVSETTIKSALGTIAGRASSPTNNALSDEFGDLAARFSREIPFSSSRKWSAMEIGSNMFVLGASEIVLSDDKNRQALQRANEISSKGLRVLVLATVKKWPSVNVKLNGRDVLPIALVVLEEKIRPDAARTLKYFAEQGVGVKIISGDSPLTVGAVAKRVGLEAKIYDARELPDPTVSKAEADRLLELVRTHNIFGRVKPEQKRQIAAALQSDGDVIAMTGDGVNDVLALKKADLGIAMNSGSAATRSVAEVVLLDDKFSHLPAVLGEGRRVAANIERVSNLFVIKNVYSMVLSLAVTALGLTYPFLPAQMTIIGALSIGIPAFFLALAPNRRLYRPGFLRRVLNFAIPVGIISAVAMFACYYLVNNRVTSLSTAGTSASVVAMLIGISVLLMLSKPVQWWKLLLIAGCGLCFALLLSQPTVAGKIGFSLDIDTLPIMAAVSAVAILLIVAVWRHDERDSLG